MLDQDADETLHRAEGGTVDHHWPMRAIVGADVFQLKALGQIVVELNGAELPLAADAIPDHEVNLWTIEGRLAYFRRIVHAHILDDIENGPLGVVPVLFAAHVLVALRIAQADANSVVLQAQRGENEQHQLDVASHLRLDLLGSDEQVRVVLSEAADASHAV